MAFALSVLRGRVQNKLNNVGTGDDVTFQPSEIDANINAAIRFIALYAPFDWVRGLSTITTVGSPITTTITVPATFFRFYYARAVLADTTTREVRLISPEEIDKLLYDSNKAPGTKYFYLCHNNGLIYDFYPAAGVAGILYLRFIVQPTALSADVDTSQISNTADDAVVDYAFALCLESKGFAPEIAQAVFDRIMKTLGVVK